MTPYQIPLYSESFNLFSSNYVYHSSISSVDLDINHFLSLDTLKRHLKQEILLLKESLVDFWQTLTQDDDIDVRKTVDLG